MRRTMDGMAQAQQEGGITCVLMDHEEEDDAC